MFVLNLVGVSVARTGSVDQLGTIADRQSLNMYTSTIVLTMRI